MRSKFILFVVVCVACLGLLVSCSSAPAANDYDLSSKDGIKDYTTAVLSEEPLINLQDVTVNDHLGDGHDGEYILLVNAEFKNENSSEQTKKTCQAVSDMFVTDLQESAPDLTECAFFFDTPLGDMKVQYERTGGKFGISDMTASF